MSALSTAAATTNATAPLAPWRNTLARLLADRWAVTGLVVVASFALIALGAALGVWAGDWAAMTAPGWSPPSAEHWLGTTRLGQDIAARALYASRTAFEIGLAVAVAATLLGGLLGGLAGYCSGCRASTWVDALVRWLTGVLEAIPFYLFVAAVAFALKGNPWAMHVAMIATFWTGTARLVRAEVLRIRQMAFVEAARMVGLAPSKVLVRHILPHTAPIVLVQGVIAFVAAIKAEVVLSFLGLGGQHSISWGQMIAESTSEVLAGFHWNFIAASTLLFVLVLGVNLLADGLQDALDPRRAARSTPGPGPSRSADGRLARAADIG
ncbi:MAG: ABC transporter permease [Wenzhouxiangellaceae bacterium]|nr:ABC transporter permease [Wenzhouxiangellaceae bacterium]